MREASAEFLGSDASAICSELHLRWPQATIVVTRGKQGAVAIDQAGDFFRAARVLGRRGRATGRGRCVFRRLSVSVFIRKECCGDALRWASATAAIKYTIPGDLPLIDRQSVAALVADTSKAGSAIGALIRREQAAGYAGRRNSRAYMRLFL